MRTIQRIGKKSNLTVNFLLQCSHLLAGRAIVIIALGHLAGASRSVGRGEPVRLPLTRLKNLKKRALNDGYDPW